ncbi:MAG: HD domain-containing protein [Verrucomicrobiota bacterium]
MASEDPLADPSMETSSVGAVMHLGAASASMLVFQRLEGGGIEQIDFLEQAVPLARDVFRSGQMTVSTVERCVEILQKFQTTMEELGVPRSRPQRTVATNLLAESSDQDVFLDRIRVACGLDVETLDDGEMTRVIYLLSQTMLQELGTLRKKSTLVVHVGPGNTRALLFEGGRICNYSSYRLGTHRIMEAMRLQSLAGAGLLQLMRQHSRGNVGQLLFDYQHAKIKHMVAIGYEIQMIAREMKGRSGVARLTPEKLRQERDRVTALSTDERVWRYQTDYQTAEALVGALELNLAIAEALEVSEIFIPIHDYESALLERIPRASELTEGFADEVIQSAYSLGEKYKIDLQHAQQVEFLAHHLFTELRSVHQLDSHSELLLRVAAITHEVGHYVSPRLHHKHSLYLIQHSEIFGLSSVDIEVVALVARYHRQSPPKPLHPVYRELSRDRRIQVSKLAALLRLADALEQSHSQRIHELEVRVEGRKLVLRASGLSDIAIEQLALDSEGDLFRNIFGLDPVLALAKSPRSDEG